MTNDGLQYVVPSTQAHHACLDVSSAKKFSPYGQHPVSTNLTTKQDGSEPGDEDRLATSTLSFPAATSTSVLGLLDESNVVAQRSVPNPDEHNALTLPGRCRLSTD